MTPPDRCTAPRVSEVAVARGPETRPVSDIEEQPTEPVDIDDPDAPMDPKAFSVVILVVPD